MALPAVVVVGVVPRRHLHAAGAEFALHEHVVGHDGDGAPHQRQQDVAGMSRRLALRRAPNQMLVALVVGMHRDGRVGEHGFGSRGRDGEIVAPKDGIGRGGAGDGGADFIRARRGARRRCSRGRLRSRAARPALRVPFPLPFPSVPPCLRAFVPQYRIPNVPQVRPHRHVLDLVVGDGGLQRRVPVDQPVPAVDQPRAEELEEGVIDGPATHVVEREARAAPIARDAHAAQLAQDALVVFVLPLPDALDQLLAAELVARQVLLLFEPLFDDGLRGDSGVVGAGHPQRDHARHARAADEDVLAGVVQGMAEVQRAGDVRRRDHDGVGPRRVCVALGRIGERGRGRR